MVGDTFIIKKCDICNKTISKSIYKSRTTKNGATKPLGECDECAEYFTTMLSNALDYFVAYNLREKRKEVV